MTQEKPRICRICNRDLSKHNGADLERCEANARQGEVLRRLSDEAKYRRDRIERFLAATEGDAG